MAINSKIEWTEATWNPCTGCSQCSEGCRNCYAKTMAKRLQAMRNPRYRNGFEVTLHEDLIGLPKRWKAPKTIFVNSMSDLFHEKVPLKFIQRVFATMADCPQHRFQVLTKRSDRLRTLAANLPWPDNVWMGVSVEDASVLHRVDDLRTVPAAVRFLSCEPLLGSLAGINLADIHWVIAGGESGPKSRRMDPAWPLQLRDDCEAMDVPFFFKQWGGINKKAAGRILDGMTYSGMPVDSGSEVGQHSPDASIDMLITLEWR